MDNFDPNGAAIENSGVFGLPYTFEDSKVILYSIPWDATTSFGSGCADAPANFVKASKFQELYDVDFGSIYKAGIFMVPGSNELVEINSETKKMTASIIEKGGSNLNAVETKNISIIDKNCERMNQIVNDFTTDCLNQGKIVGTIGGDHSVILGAVKAHVKKYPNLGILQIDAHADLRNAFEGLKYSHASIMNNVLMETKVKILVQVGVRALCKAEYDSIKSSKRIKTFFQSELDDNTFAGVTWKESCKQIVGCLPEEIYISIDIDGLSHDCCPGTGTPVPGGMTYTELTFLLRELAKSKKKIVGFDLVEVGNTDWDAIVASDLIYKLCGTILL